MASKRITDIEDVNQAHAVADRGLRVSARVRDEPRVRHYAAKRQTADTLARQAKHWVREEARSLMAMGKGDFVREPVL